MADETPALALHPISIQPVRRTAPTAIWSLVLAIPSLFCGWLFTAIPAVFCGHMARAKIRKAGGALGDKEIATAGLILGRPLKPRWQKPRTLSGLREVRGSFRTEK